MSDAARLLELFVIGLMISWTLIALLAALIVLLDLLREPPSWILRRRIPDTYDPNDWQPRGSDVSTDRT